MIRTHTWIATTGGPHLLMNNSRIGGVSWDGAIIEIPLTKVTMPVRAE
jgi:hypothetical protein